MYVIDCTEQKHMHTIVSVSEFSARESTFMQVKIVAQNRSVYRCSTKQSSGACRPHNEALNQA